MRRVGSLHAAGYRIALGCALATALVGGVVSGRLARAATVPTIPTPQQQTQAIADAASAYLAALGGGQRGVTQRPFDPQKAGTLVTFARAGRQDRPVNGAAGADFVAEKYGQAVWSNFPIGGAPRVGLQLGFMSVAQRAAAMRLLQTALSPMGYRKVLDIMAGDKVFAAGGLPYAAGPDAFVLGIFGKPSATAPWMITFTGHHLGLNIVLAGPRATIVPTLTGAEPTRYIDHGRIVRVLARENDTAFTLLNALDAEQRRKAVLSYDLADLAYGPGHGGEVFVPEGIKGSEMTAPQKALMLGVIREWADMIHPAYGRARIAEIERELDDTWFSWRGPVARTAGWNGAAYYRIQGPKVIVEFSPQTNDGDARLHVHTIYRDPTDDYGHTFTM